ncbi:MAG TPA: HlyD family efflux transporter periplasmic adaptor subunit [Isosphaeraceae bacterium]|jgi:multidrug efflux pump subunit AcrA (membrane-fusion protein)|nr:HlyD family efflux transporter periplasmic adaptor subunit [Isosphaeraceae bacterium]
MTGRLWFFAALIAAGLVGCHGGSSPEEAKDEHAAKGKDEEKKAEEAHVSVRTQPARLGTIAQTVEGLGRSEAVPEKLAPLTPAVQGHIDELLVKLGEPVKKGQPIVELDKAVALADLAEKTATLDGLKAALQLLKALPRPEERRANELAIDQAKLAYERAKRVADHIRPLLAHNEVSEQQVYEAEAAVAQAKLQQQTAEAQLRAMMIGPKPEAVAEAEAKIKTAEGALELSKATLTYHTIRSKIDGILDSLTCHPGETLAIGTPIGEVVDTRQVLALVYLPASSAQAVRVGQHADVRTADSRLEASASESEKPSAEEKEEKTAPAEGKEEKAPAAEAKDAKPAQGEEKDDKPKSEEKAEKAPAEKHPEKTPPLEGTVVFVGRITDPQTGNLPVHVLVDNPKGQLTVGQTVSLSITVDERSGVLQVPVAAILDLGEGPVLTVIREGKTAVLHPELGVAHDGWVAVSGTDLKAGEQVVVEGGYNLPEGTPVHTGAEEKVARAEAHK